MIGQFYDAQNNLTEATSYYQKSLLISSQINDLSLQAKSCLDIADVFTKQGNYSNALEYIKKGIQLYETLEDPRGKAIALNQLGSIEFIQNHYEEAKSRRTLPTYCKL